MPNQVIEFGEVNIGVGATQYFPLPPTMPHNVDGTTLFAHSGTAQAAAAGSLTLSAGASAVDNFYTNKQVVVTGGTGAGQVRVISAYNGTTKVATITPGWTLTPAGVITYAILPDVIDRVGRGADKPVISFFIESLGAVAAPTLSFEASFNQFATVHVVPFDKIIANGTPTLNVISSVDLATVGNYIFSVRLFVCPPYLRAKIVAGANSVLVTVRAVLTDQPLTIGS